MRTEPLQSQIYAIERYFGRDYEVLNYENRLLEEEGKIPIDWDFITIRLNSDHPCNQAGVYELTMNYFGVIRIFKVRRLE